MGGEEVEADDEGEEVKGPAAALIGAGMVAGLDWAEEVERVGVKRRGEDCTAFDGGGDALAAMV
jgi:hypothetical protein